MRIGIDARALIGQRAGISKFVLGILDVFGRQDWEHEFILYAHKPFAFDPPNPRWRACVYRGVPGTRGGAAWLQLYGRLLAKRDGIDVYWGPVFHLPILFAGQIPSVVTVHDLVHLFFPKTMELRNYVLMKLFLRPSLWCAHHVTADSEATARDLGRHMGVPSRKITVIYPAASREFQPRDPEQAHRRIREVFGVDDPYLLSVATLEPRKNLQTLIRAFAMLPESVRRRWPLVIAGGSGWKNSSLYEAAAPLVQEGTVRFLGYVADADLPWLYAGAALFLFASIYEGFGIPVVEAMASGVPVIASDIPVLREVAGDAAIFIPPTGPHPWAETILSLLHDNCRAAVLREAGLRRAGYFSFETSARRLLTILESVAKSHGDDARRHRA